MVAKVSHAIQFVFFDILITGLIKGITLPFPVLRRMVLMKSSSSSQQQQQQQRRSRLSIGLTFREGVLALVAYLLTGVLIYSFVLERWSIIDALYFTCVCFSTVGYGDLCPTHTASRIFTCFFGMGGVAFLGAAVAAIGGRIGQATDVQSVQSAITQTSRHRIFRLFDGMPAVLSKFREHSAERQRKELLEQAKRARAEFRAKVEEDPLVRVVPLEASFPRVLRKIIVASFSYAALLFAGGLCMRYLNGNKWTICESVYYTLATGTLNRVGLATSRVSAGTSED